MFSAYSVLCYIISWLFAFRCAGSVRNEDNVPADCFGWSCFSAGCVMDENGSLVCSVDVYNTGLFLASRSSHVSSVKSSSGSC